jgi:uncharacterized protein (TIGR02145 family)
MRYWVLYIGLFIFSGYYSFAQVIGHFTDPRDGKQYKTIKIGSQTWMGENLAWKYEKDCWAYNNNDSIAAVYGRLYTWEVAKRSCPLNWHLPSDEEWKKLIEYLGGDTAAGGKLKEAGLVHWQKPNVEGSDKSGFTSLPAGNRSSFNGAFYGLGKYTCWWSSSEHTETGEIYVNSVSNVSGAINSGYHNREFGYSVRCVKN